MSDTYEHISRLVSRIRNARFGEMVAYVEELIDGSEWRDFTSPVGTRFRFRRCEFDYFLAAQEIDPTLVRTAYAKAQDVDSLAVKTTRLADITGRGVSCNGDRRKAVDVAKEYSTDPSGAGARIEQWAHASTAVVSESITRVARNPVQRKRYEATGQLPALKQRWHVDWRDDSKTRAQRIADKLLTDPDLAHEVYKILDSWEVRNRKASKRRSEAQNGSHGPDHE